MQKPLKPTNEVQRQRRLDELKMASSPSALFEDAVRVASQICGTPMAMVSLIDGDRQWAKARVGELDPGHPRELAFCAHVVETGKFLLVTDAASDDRFRDHPLVVGFPHLRFYAGAPLAFASGEVLGTLAVLAANARALTPAQHEALCATARGLVAYLELRAIVLATPAKGDVRTPAALKTMGAALDGIRDHTWPIADRTSLEVARRAWRDLSGEPEPSAARGATARPLAGADVLVVEDATIHQKVIRALLEPHGAIVHVAATGEEAIERFAERPFALVLMDRHLPGIDGLETTRLMRAREAAYRTPILGCSATTDLRSRDEFLIAGADDTIAKPVRLDEFWAKFNALALRPRAAG